MLCMHSQKNIDCSLCLIYTSCSTDTIIRSRDIRITEKENLDGWCYKRKRLESLCQTCFPLWIINLIKIPSLVGFINDNKKHTEKQIQCEILEIVHQFYMSTILTHHIANGSWLSLKCNSGLCNCEISSWKK